MSKLESIASAYDQDQAPESILCPRMTLPSVRKLAVLTMIPAASKSSLVLVTNEYENEFDNFIIPFERQEGLKVLPLLFIHSL